MDDRASAWKKIGNSMDEVLLGEDDDEKGEWKYDLKGLSPVSRSPVPTWEPSPVDR